MDLKISLKSGSSYMPISSRIYISSLLVELRSLQVRQKKASEEARTKIRKKKVEKGGRGAEKRTYTNPFTYVHTK